MNYYRISKYDPQYRIDGIYQKDEWTSMSDIGNIYGGKVFTEDEYYKVEPLQDEGKFVKMCTAVFYLQD